MAAKKNPLVQLYRYPEKRESKTLANSNTKKPDVLEQLKIDKMGMEQVRLKILDHFKNPSAKEIKKIMTALEKMMKSK